MPKTILTDPKVDVTIIDHDHSVEPPRWSCCGAEIDENSPKCPRCS